LFAPSGPAIAENQLSGEKERKNQIMKPLIKLKTFVIGFMKQHFVELSPINHFSASAAFVKVPFLHLA
jgi:hypothetical protein